MFGNAPHISSVVHGGGGDREIFGSISPALPLPAIGVGFSVGLGVGLGVGFSVGLGVGFSVGLGVGFLALMCIFNNAPRFCGMSTQNKTKTK